MLLACAHQLCPVPCINTVVSSSHAANLRDFSLAFSLCLYNTTWSDCLHSRRCSESQKIGHVTFFWNGNRGGPFNKDLEKHKEVRVLRLGTRQLAHSCCCTNSTDAFSSPVARRHK